MARFGMSFGGGFAQGLNQGVAFANAVEDAQMRRDIGEAAKQYNVQDSGVSSADDYSNAASGLDMSQFDSPEQFAAAEKAYRDAAANFKGQYTVGGKGFGDASAAGDYANARKLAAISDVYTRYGKPEDALRLKALSMDMESKGLDIASKKRANKEADTIDNLKADFRKRVADPAAYMSDLFNRDVVGGAEMAGKKVQYTPTNGGHMAWVTDADGNAVVKDGVPLARHFTNEQLHDMAFEEFLKQSNPEAYGTYVNVKRKNDSDTAYHTAHLGLVGQQLAETSRHNKAAEGISAGNANRLNRLADRQIAATDDKILEQQQLRGIGDALSAYEAMKADPKYQGQTAAIDAGIRGLRARAEGIQGKFTDPYAPGKASKPDITFKEFSAAFPPNSGEPEEAYYRRYQRFVNPSTGQGGLGALGKVAGTQNNASVAAPVVDYPNRADYVADGSTSAVGPKLGLWWDKVSTGTANQTDAWKREIARREAAIYGISQ